MKRILLTTFCFLSIGGVVMAQESAKPAATTNNHKFPRPEHKVADAKRVAYKLAQEKSYSESLIQPGSTPKEDKAVDAQPQRAAKTN